MGGRVPYGMALNVGLQSVKIGTTANANTARGAIVLVHGGFVNDSGWESVRIVKKAGYRVSIVQNPTTSLADEVAITNKAVRFAIPGRREHIFDPFHECADSARQVAPMRYYQGDVA